MVFEDVYAARDSATLEQLKEVSSKRRVIEESINESSFVTEAIAREMYGGFTSPLQQVILSNLCLSVYRDSIHSISISNSYHFFIRLHMKQSFFPKTNICLFFKSTWRYVKELP